MLALKLSSNQYIDIKKDASVAITVTGALLDTDHVNRTYSFDFDLSRTERNDSELKHAHQIDAAQSDAVKAEMILAGMPFTEGVLDVTDISENNYRANFKSVNRKILDELGYELSTFAQETVTIADITQGVDIPLAETYRLQFTGLNPSERTIHHLYFGNRHWSLVILPGQTAAQAAQTFAVNITNMLGTRNGIPAAEAQGDILIINSWYNTRSVPVQRGYDLIIKQGDNFEIVAYNSYDIAVHRHIIQQVQGFNSDPNSNFVFPSVAVPNTSLSNFGNIINNAEIGEGRLLQNSLEIAKTSLNILVPMMKVKYVIQKIANRLDLIPSGEWWNYSESSQLVIFNTVALDNYVEYDGPEGKRYLNQFGTTFTPGNHLPKMSAKDFLNYVCETFGLKMSVKRGHLKFDFKKNAYDAIPRNFTAFLEPNTLVFEKKKDSAVKIEYATDSNIIVPSDQLTAYNTRAGAAEYKSYTLSMMTLPMVFKNLILTTVRLPQYHGKINELPKVVLFYRGIQDIGGAKYPYATHDNLHPSGVGNVGEWSLSPDALYRDFLRNIAELEAAPTASADFRLTADEFIAFEKGDYTRFMAYSPRGMIHAVIKKMRIKATSKKISTVTIDMVRV